MPTEENKMDLGEFLTDRMREKGVSLKRLSDTTGIAQAHIASMLHEDFEALPSAPYFRGYLIRLGSALDFDGESIWKKVRDGTPLKNSGSADTMPENRFIKREGPKGLFIAIGIALIFAIYLAVALPRIMGQPSITVSFPSTSPYVTTSTSVTLSGIIRNADSLYLTNGGASSSEQILIAPDGSWAKNVLLGAGINDFRLIAKKFLGSQAEFTEEIVYNPPGGTTDGTANGTTVGTTTAHEAASASQDKTSGQYKPTPGATTSPSSSNSF